MPSAVADIRDVAITAAEDQLAAIYYFLESPHEASVVLAWFRDQSVAPDEFPNDDGVLMYFSHWGRLASTSDGSVDVHRSPVVSVTGSQVRRKALWTVGEVHFLPERLRTTFPRLETLRRNFHNWLGEHSEVFNQRAPDGHLGYYLEGSVRNVADRVVALPSGLAAIESGQYFVGHGDGVSVIDDVCRSLRLRGIDCA